MKTQILIAASLLLFLRNCEPGESSILTGEVTSEFNGYMYIEYNGIIDSVFVDSRVFEFRGNVNHPTMAYIIGSSMRTESFIIENKKQNITLNIDNQSLSIENYSGQTFNEVITDFKSLYDSLQFNPNLELHLFNKLENMFSEYPQSQLNGSLLNFVPISNNLSTASFLNLYSILDTSTQIPAELEMIKMRIQKRKKFATGEAFYNYQIPDLDSNMVYISDYQDTVLLIEFWASWCKGCLEKNSHLKELYRNYNDYGFEILGISVDDNRDDMMRIINGDSLEWDNFRVSLGDPFIDELGISFFPSNFLIDIDGAIIATNINTITIEEKLGNTLIK